MTVSSTGLLTFMFDELPSFAKDNSSIWWPKLEQKTKIKLGYEERQINKLETNFSLVDLQNKTMTLQIDLKEKQGVKPIKLQI